MNDEKKIMRFELSPKDIKIKNLLNQQFLYVEIDAINSMYPNLNESHFTPESLDNCIPTVYNKPILAHYINGKDDFGSHDDNGVQYDKELDYYYYDYSLGNVEIPIGLVREQDNVHTNIDPATGLTHLIVPCAIWCAYNYKACKKLLKSPRTRVSVEIEVTGYHYDEKGIEIIESFVLMGISLLGSDIREAVTGSHLSVPEMASTSVFQAQTKRLKFAYQELDKQNHSEQKIEKPDNDKPIPNENVDRISMDEPEDRTSRYSEISVADLTYEQKKSLIAQEFMRLEDDADFWIEDIANTYVIIYYHSDDEHCNYKVGYIIDDDPNHTVHLDWDNKEKVIRTWKTFKKDNVNDVNTNKIFDSKEDTPEMREVFRTSTDAENLPADVSPSDNTNPNNKEKFEGKDIVENPGPEMGIVMSTEGKEEKPEDKEDKTEKEACNPEDQCKNSCEEPEKNCNSEDSDGSSKEECAKEDSCDDKMCNSEEGCKEEESCPEDKQEEGCKESEACDNKEVEGCENKETEGCEDKEAESCDPEKKEDEACKETESCNPEDQCKNSCPEDECKMSDDPNGEHFSDDPHGEHFATVNVHGEDLNINQLLEKFTVLEDSYNNLKEKYSAFEMKEFKAFALDTINKESRLLDETKTSVRDEVMNAISCGKFSTKDEVEKFTVQSMAMALFNQKEVESAENTEKESEGTKSEFEATIVKNPIGADENKVKKAKTGIDSLLEANNALKFV